MNNDNRQYADSFQAMEGHKEDRSGIIDAVTEPVDLVAQEAAQEAQKARSREVIRKALSKMEAMFGRK